MSNRIIGINRRWFPAQASVIGKAAIEVPPELALDGMNDQADDPPPTVCVEEACCHFPGGQLEREKYRS